MKVIMISVLIVVVLGVALWYFYADKSPASEVQSTTDAATQGVLPSIGEASNPLTNKPDINPTSKTNPFNSVQTNPFD